MTHPSSAGGIASSIVRRTAADQRRDRVRELLAAHPSMSTDTIAEMIGVDRSTIRRDRKKIGLALARGNAVR